MNFVKFLRTPFLQNSSGRLLSTMLLIRKFLKDRAFRLEMLVVMSHTAEHKEESFAKSFKLTCQVV